MTETSPVFLNASFTYQLGDQGKQVSIQTSFLRDADLREILKGMDKARLIMDVQRAHAEVKKYSFLIEDTKRDIISTEKDIDDSILKADAEWKKSNPDQPFQLLSHFERHISSQRERLKAYQEALPALESNMANQLLLISEAEKTNVSDIRTDN